MEAARPCAGRPRRASPAPSPVRARPSGQALRHRSETAPHDPSYRRAQLTRQVTGVYRRTRGPMPGDLVAGAGDPRPALETMTLTACRGYGQHGVVLSG